MHVERANDFFKHNPPTPLEIENAIMIVEDEVKRARGLAGGHARLYSTDELIYTVAKVAGYADKLPVTLAIEQVETLFDQFAARSEGRPSTQDGLPNDPQFSATLLILREFMHHLKFDEIRIRRTSEPMGNPTN